MDTAEAARHLHGKQVRVRLISGAAFVCRIGEVEGEEFAHEGIRGAEEPTQSGATELAEVHHFEPLCEPDGTNSGLETLLNTFIGVEPLSARVARLHPVSGSPFVGIVLETKHDRVKLRQYSSQPPEQTRDGEVLYSDLIWIEPLVPLWGPKPVEQAFVLGLHTLPEDDQTGRAVRVTLKGGRTYAVYVLELVTEKGFLHEELDNLPSGETRAGTGITFWESVETVEPLFKPFPQNPLLQARLEPLVQKKDPKQRLIRVFLNAEHGGGSFVATIEDRVSETAFCHEALENPPHGEKTRGGVTWYYMVDDVEVIV